MIFENIFKTISIRHYASSDNNKVVLGFKFGTLDDVRITLSTKRFKSIMAQLNKINDSISPPQTGLTNESSKATRKSRPKNN